MTSLARQFPAGPRARTLLTWTGAAALALALAWGARLTYLEGFHYARSGGFQGDFHAAMFDDRFFDGEGIFYGPLFVIERWLVDGLPSIFTIELFAYLNFAFILIAFVAITRLLGLSVWLSALVAVLWLGHRRLYYSLSVAANPEIFELLLLTGAWWWAAKRSDRGEGAAIATAGLMKLVPYLFFFQVIFRRRWKALIVGAGVAGTVAITVGAGQGLLPWTAIHETLFPPGGPVSAGGSWLQSGVGATLSRIAFGERPLSGGEEAFVVRSAFGIFIGLLVLGGLMIRALERKRVDHSVRVAITYSLFFALLPVASLVAHPHTFIFLLPAWAGLVALLSRPLIELRWRIALGAFFGLCWVATGISKVWLELERVVPGDFTQRMAEEPILGTLGVVLGTLALGFLVARSAPSKPAEAA